MHDIEELEVEIAQLEDENAALLSQRNNWRRLAEDSIAVIRKRENATREAISKLLKTFTQLDRF